MRLILGIILVFLFSLVANAQLYTKYSKPLNIDSIVQNLFASPNVQISNVSFKGFSVGVNGDIKDIGFFNSINSTVGVDSGIILTSGLLDPPYGLGQASINGANYFKPTQGDSLLNTLINYPTDFTSGAAVLEFDFVPNGDSIKFEYVFASDEYPQQLCIDDNDVFAFFISGAGISGVKNIALVPNTNLPVCINSINDTSIVSYAYNVPNCYSVSNSQYYVNHINDTNFIFNGSTTVLTAKEKTIPCQTYHLKFAIAEVGSLADNSAVFLKANSFNSEPIKITSEVNYSNGDTALYESCSGAKLIIRRTYNIQTTKTYSLNFSGSALNGIDYQLLPTTITMLPNQMYDTIYLQPIQDLIADNFENIILKIGDTLCNGNYYETSINFTIIEKNNLIAEIASNSHIYCDSAKFILNILNEIKPININWLNNLSLDSIFTYYPNSFNNNYYINSSIFVSVSDACGQFDNDTVNVIFSKKPIADFYTSPNQIQVLLTDVNFSNTSSYDSNLFSWFFSNCNYSSNQKNIQYTFLDTGKYQITLLVSNQFNCKDSITKEIIVNEPNNVFVPNSFTPNNDGLNDTFKPIVPYYKTATLQIFNRWGDLILNTNNIEQGWDGKIKGANAPNDVYVYKLFVEFLDGKAQKLDGHITLAR
jgi:gliding motility-associated-like protein